MGMPSIFMDKINNLDPEVKAQYGEDLIKSEEINFMRTKYFMWDPINVRNSIISAVEVLSTAPQALVGTDTKYIFMLSRMLPVSIIDRLIPVCKAAALKENSK